MRSERDGDVRAWGVGKTALWFCSDISLTGSSSESNQFDLDTIKIFFSAKISGLTMSKCGNFEPIIFRNLYDAQELLLGINAPIHVDR